MAQGWLIEIRVACEKRGTALSTQQNQNLLIFQALAAEVETNLSRGHPPCLEQQSLPIKDVLVENNQACARSSTYSGAVYSAE